MYWNSTSARRERSRNEELDGDLRALAPEQAEEHGREERDAHDPKYVHRSSRPEMRRSLLLRLLRPL